MLIAVCGLVFRCLVFDDCCLLLLLFVVCSFLWIVCRCSLFVVRGVLGVRCCLLTMLIDCCLLIVVC